MVRRALMMALICTVAIPAFAGDRDKDKEKKKDGPNWATSVDAAIQEAKDRNAPIMIYFGGTG